jgi:KDO2-lipid IV(A) lauroyltransferase
MTSLQSIVSGPRAIQLGLFFSQHTPEAIGHRLSWWAAGATCRLKPAVYRIVRSNLGQVLGTGVSRQALELATRRVFDTAIRGYYDLFRALRLSEEEMAALVDVPEATMATARSLWDRKGGTLIVFPHLGSFDLGGHAVVPYLPEMQLFTLPDPPPGFQLLNESRRRAGVTVTPLSSVALRQAIKLLRRGGIVSLAGDRPVSELDEPFPFFGRPARLPSGHVRMALKTGAVVTIGYCTLSPETQRYTMHLEPPMEMTRTGNRDEEVQLNMQRILAALERIIGRWPEQWQMFVPVWPELLHARGE